MKTKKYNRGKSYVISLIMALFLFNSCVEDVIESTKEPARYTGNDIKSYADLFDVFWTVMNQKYNYFNEQGNMDWEAVYKEYAPKFKQLKTFNLDERYSNSEISEDYEKAEEYFTDIIDPILDRHFYVRIKMPVSRNYVYKTRFWGGMKNEEMTHTYPFEDRYVYMKSRIDPSRAVLVAEEEKALLGGFLKDNPGIYYFGLSSFMISDEYILSFKGKYLDIDDKSRYYLGEKEIKDSIEASGIVNPAVKKVLLEKSVECMNKFNAFMRSDTALNAINKIKDFNTSENLDQAFIEALFKVKATAPDMNAQLYMLNFIPEFSSNQKYAQWFARRLTDYLELACEYPVFLDDIKKALDSPEKINFYKNFVTPLKKGEIKKIILDFRGNQGGHVADLRTFTDRFITRDAVFAYQRFKEDNNPFSYTPWAPCMTKATGRGIKKEIPIVVLIDRLSASMSEISTLMLRSQGKHVVVVGEYSAGATAGLGPADDFNGGLLDIIAGGYLEFYMPLLAMQDASHTVIEGIGIKPDILMEPLTEDEVDEMSLSPAAHTDRALEKAIEVLNKQ